jgi:hypothetical protein
MPFTIQSRLNWLVLDIEGDNPNKGARVITWPRHGKSNQLWIYRDGYIESCKNGLVLDIDGANMNAGTRIIMWEKNGGANQQWKISADGQIVSSSMDSSLMSRVQELKLVLESYLTHHMQEIIKNGTFTESLRSKANSIIYLLMFKMVAIILV